MIHSKIKAAFLLITPVVLMSCSSGNEMVNNFYEDGIYYDESYGGHAVSSSFDSDQDQYNTPNYDPLNQDQQYDYYSPDDVNSDRVYTPSGGGGNTTTIINYNVGWGSPYSRFDMMYGGYSGWGFGYGVGFGYGYNSWGYPGYGYPHYGNPYWGNPYWGNPYWGGYYGYNDHHNYNPNRRRAYVNNGVSRSSRVTGNKTYSTPTNGVSKRATRRSTYTPHSQRSNNISHREVRTQQGRYSSGKNSRSRSRIGGYTPSRTPSRSYTPSQSQGGSGQNYTPNRSRTSSPSHTSSPTRTNSGSRGRR